MPSTPPTVPPEALSQSADLRAREAAQPPQPSEVVVRPSGGQKTTLLVFSLQKAGALGSPGGGEGKQAWRRHCG